MDARFLDTPFNIGVPDSTVQHGRRSGRGELSGERRLERIRFRVPFQDQDQAGVGAELPDPQGERTVKSGRDRFRAVLEGPRQNKDGIDTAHLGIDRDGFRPGRRQVEKGPSTGSRAGEAHRFHRRVPDQGLADHPPRTVDQGKSPFRKTAALHRIGDGLSHDLGRTGMGVMRLHHDRASGGQGRSGIPAGHREREREIAGAEYDHRANRPEHIAKIRLWNGLPIGHRGIDAGINPGSLVEQIGEESQLSGGASGFTGQSTLGQSGFGRAALPDLLGHRFDVGCDLPEESRPVPAGPSRKRLEGRFGKLSRPVDFPLVSTVKVG